MLRVAEDLDADYVIYGRYAASGTSLTIEMRMLSMNPMALRPALRESGPLTSLTELHTRLLWRLLRSNDRHYALSLAEFTKRQRRLRVGGFEPYVPGVVGTADAAKLRQMHGAARVR